MSLRPFDRAHFPRVVCFAPKAGLTSLYASELVALSPDVILTSGAAAVVPLLQATRSVPIVFVLVADPVAAGIVDSLARPGGIVTGFTSFEYSFGGKWLELLKEVAPSVTRAAVIRDPTDFAGIGVFGAVQTAASSVGVELSPVNVRDASEMERAIAAFARGSNGGLILTPGGLAFIHRDLIVTLAARHKLPAVYFSRPFVVAGGLASYGPDNLDQYRRAAGYVDRILKGEKPADLPVQAPTKYEPVINLKTARALGLHIPAAVLARADEVNAARRHGHRVAARGARAAGRADAPHRRAHGCGRYGRAGSHRCVPQGRLQ
jgi:putative tryptophan/tyrosine transport system substrate-binding protein